ncbi:hypothetical protein AMTR_s00009p00265980 [Amborella trichopoda]|uniref:Uncharacterized protein n=1 Tax=Amborella trichopoda TaxID=13333 RepID=W1NHF7_AMBTC|nr:hypothetical protein AMTR_s00009p00265980 [Amborella trichopoda]
MASLFQPRRHQGKPSSSQHGEDLPAILPYPLHNHPPIPKVHCLPCFQHLQDLHHFRMFPPPVELPTPRSRRMWPTSHDHCSPFPHVKNYVNGTFNPPRHDLKGIIN